MVKKFPHLSNYSPGEPSTHTPIHPPTRPTIIHPHIHPCIHPPIHKAIHPSTHTSLHPPTHPSIHPPILPSFHPSIQTSTQLFTVSSLCKTNWAETGHGEEHEYIMATHTHTPMSTAIYATKWSLRTESCQPRLKLRSNTPRRVRQEANKHGWTNRRSPWMPSEHRGREVKSWSLHCFLRLRAVGSSS